MKFQAWASTDPRHAKSNLNFYFPGAHLFFYYWLLQPAFQKYSKNIAAYFPARLLVSF